MKDNLSQPHPSRQVIWGQELKELMGQFRHGTGMGTQTNDEMVYENFITVSDSVADEYGPVAEIHYEPTEETMKRHERQTSRKVDFARQAGGPNVKIAMNYPGGSGSHPFPGDSASWASDKSLLVHRPLRGTGFRQGEAMGQLSLSASQVGPVGRPGAMGEDLSSPEHRG